MGPSVADIEAQRRAGRLADAEAACRARLAQLPGDAATFAAWARVRRDVGDLTAALDLQHRAMALGAGPAALLDLADLLLDAGRPGEAEPLVRQAAQRAVRSAGVAYLTGRLERARGRPDLAVERFRAASRTDPEHIAARHALARTLAELGRIDEAAAAFEALLKRRPGDIEALKGLGWVEGRRHRFAAALAAFDRAEAAGADITRELGETVLAMAHACDWSCRAALVARLRQRLEQDMPCFLDPFALLATVDDPAVHGRLAWHLAASVRSHAGPSLAARPVGEGARIRLGYLSGDFNQHATALLMAEVFAHHDRDRFEAVAFCYSADDGSATRTRTLAAFDRVERLGLEPPAASARRIAAAGIDILIDLKGYTTGARPEIAALRPAPIQVSHLGYPASMGGNAYDYVIADATVLPMAEQANWSERIVHLPGSYQPNDRSRAIPASPPSRAELGLPEDALVLAVFNNSYKIDADAFALWMSLLAGLPQAVLWIYESNPLATAALRAHAEGHGIAQDRLFFAPPVELAAHIARHAAADLFLDTWPYGGHTTAADALWAGLPVVTWSGRCFASRVAASLLRAVGLDELVAADPEGYHALVRALAADPLRRGRIREHLLAARTAAPLFDAIAFARHLEAAYQTMIDRHRTGLPPAGFAVAPG